MVRNGHEKRGPTPKENAGRRAGGRHAFARGRAHHGLSRHLARRPLPSFEGRQISQTSGARRAARTIVLGRNNNASPRIKSNSHTNELQRKRKE
jgi:hypothetical protein